MYQTTKEDFEVSATFDMTKDDHEGIWKRIKRALKYIFTGEF